MECKNENEDKKSLLKKNNSSKNPEINDIENLKLSD